MDTSQNVTLQCNATLKTLQQTTFEDSICIAVPFVFAIAWVSSGESLSGDPGQRPTTPPSTSFLGGQVSRLIEAIVTDYEKWEIKYSH